MYKVITIIIAIIFLASCASLPIYKSINESEYNKETIYSGYDANSRLRWLVTNDSLNLYLRLGSDNPATITKILNIGMQIYIDSTAKKKEGLYINYPVYETDEISKKDNNKISLRNTIDERNVKLSLMLQKTSKTIKYVKADEIHLFNALDKNADIFASLNSDNNGNLQYFVKIPFKLITKTKLKLLSIGINIEGFDIEMPENKNEESNMFNTNRNINRRHSRDDSSFEKQPELAKDIDIWFKVNLTN